MNGRARWRGVNVFVRNFTGAACRGQAVIRSRHGLCVLLRSDTPAEAGGRQGNLRQGGDRVGGIRMRRLPFELYGASALMVAATALLVRAWRRERSVANRAMSKVSHIVSRRAA